MLTLVSSSSGQERINGGTNAGPAYQGSRVIEVYEDEPMQGNTDAQPEQAIQAPKTVPIRNQTGAGVEMIIGGQGEGGVAKKGTLPVVD